MAAQPAHQTSTKTFEKDISFTNQVTHVYVKVDTPTGLAARFEGPYKIVSRPSRSTLQVRVGSFVSGEPRLLTLHWSMCKPAHMRQDAEESSRPSRGRPRKSPDPTVPDDSQTTTDVESDVNNAAGEKLSQPVDEPAKIQTPQSQQQKLRRQFRSTRNPNPTYVDALTRNLGR